MFCKINSNELFKIKNINFNFFFQIKLIFLFIGSFMIVKSAQNQPNYSNSKKIQSNDLFTRYSDRIDQEILTKSQYFLSYDADYKTLINYEKTIEDVQCAKTPPKKGKMPQNKTKMEENQEFDMRSFKKSQSEDSEENISSMKGGLSRKSIILTGNCAQDVDLDSEHDALAISGILFRKLLFIQNEKDDNLKKEGEFALENYGMLFEYLWQNRPFTDNKDFNESELDSKIFLDYAATNDFEKNSSKIYNFQSLFFINQLQQEIKGKPEKKSYINEIPPRFLQLCKNLKFCLSLFYANLKKFASSLFIEKNNIKIDFNEEFKNLLHIKKKLSENIRADKKQHEPKKKQIHKRKSNKIEVPWIWKEIFERDLDHS